MPSPEIQKLLNKQQWRRRSRAQLRDEPLCRICFKKGKVVAASVADHIEPHRGDPKKFFGGELQSLCRPCHNHIKQFIEVRGFDKTVGDDGLPLDPNHPFNKTRGD